MHKTPAHTPQRKACKPMDKHPSMDPELDTLTCTSGHSHAQRWHVHVQVLLYIKTLLAVHVHAVFMFMPVSRSAQKHVPAGMDSAAFMRIPPSVPESIRWMRFQAWVCLFVCWVLLLCYLCRLSHAHLRLVGM